ncbi:MAG TPA: DJ-1/PfpI family protein [Sedimentisphaerales bacterium]|nr:DJ-1/PfpI family protein [Sedimentisphaerales bacterium]HQI26856.1 DJ-1/PfpI family protein [Sedimentisphaerales bacterium]
MKLRLFPGECPRLPVIKMFWASLCLVSSLVAVAAETQSPSPSQPQPPTQVGPVRRAPAPRLQPIQLPEPAARNAVTFEKAVLELQKVQPPAAQRLDSAKISQLAWAIRNSMPAPPASNRPAPNGDESPMKAFFVLPDGFFVYEPLGHTLQPVSEGDIRMTLAAALMKQSTVLPGGCQILLTASTRDYTARFGTRSRTVMAMQIGKVAQTLQLEAVAQGLGLIALDAVEGADVRRVARIPRGYEPMYAVIVGYPAGQVPETAVQPSATQIGRRALLVVPPRGFQDQELLETRRALELGGVQVAVTSTRVGPLVGMNGTVVQADLLVNQVNLDNFDAVVFIGGVGATEYVHTPMVQNLARQVSVRRKVLAAIGTAPTILAGAGVLRGVRVTAYLSEQESIARAGAFYTGNPAEKDGLIITATGPLAAPLFTKAILEGLGEIRP